LSLVLRVLFHDIGKPPTSSSDEAGASASMATTAWAEMTEALMERLRFLRAETEATVAVARQHMVSATAQHADRD
jgi:UTP:GlnB (protein PII) uridylyltransferase